MNIPEKIKDRRVSFGMSQRELADKTNLNQEEISRIESGKRNTGMENLAKIFKVLKLKLAEHD